MHRADLSGQAAGVAGAGAGGEAEAEVVLPPALRNLLVQGLVLNSTASLRSSRQGNPTDTGGWVGG